MQIELVIDDKRKLFTTPFVPMLAKRKYLEIQANIEEREDPATARQIIEEDDALFSILSDIVFNRQFTLEELYKGTSIERAQEKLREAVFGEKPKKKEESEGNEQGE